MRDGPGGPPCSDDPGPLLMPAECLFSFICSANNNIARITLMLSRLREAFGEPVAVHDGVAYHRFPALEALAAVPEERLRALGFGYRARYGAPVLLACLHVC